MMPYFKVQIVLPGNPETGDADKMADAWIQPEQIESFNNGYHWGCLIYMKSGQAYMLKISAEDFEKGLNTYYQHVSEQMAKAQRSAQSGILLQ